MSVMIWCESPKCKEQSGQNGIVIWAYDHAEPYDVRGLFNQMKMPCPRCGIEGWFNGWAGWCHATDREFCHEHDEPCDDWGLMHAQAKVHDVKWEISPRNIWFWKPEGKEGGE